jgi:SAM-dependent methyltransferase
MKKVYRCPSCHQQSMQVFHRISGVPSNSCILMKTYGEATQYPRGDIHLGFCEECGFISNVAFNPRLTEYSEKYEETQGFSATFNAFHRALADRLIDKYDIHNKDIIEIGCGKGEFLALLCDLGGNRGVGFDPGFIPSRVDERSGTKFRVVQDFYSEKYADYAGDFVACKMTLEHIPDVGEFIATVRRSIGERYDTVVFFQIPSVTRILDSCAFEDIYYEHCSYFSPGSLARLFRRNRFDVLALGTEYDDQYLTIEALPTQENTSSDRAEEDDLSLLKASVGAFRERYEEKLSYWRHRLGELSRQDATVAIWGSGSKGVAFLSAVDEANTVRYAVDINPYRRHYHMPGTGQEILGPEDLPAVKPDALIVMNPIYRDEIQAQVVGLGLRAEIMTL